MAKRILFILAFGFAILFDAQSQITGIKINGDTCNSLTLDLQVIGTSSAPTFFWNFDDPASGINDTITITGSSTSAFPTHTFSSPGVYNICVSFQEPGFPVSTVCRTISIGLCCSGIIVASDTCLQNDISFSIQTEANISGITWNFGDPASGLNNISNDLSPAHLFSSPGLFNISANVIADCGVFQVIYTINVSDCTNTCTGNIISSGNCLSEGTTFQIVSNKIIDSVLWDFGDPSTDISNNTSELTPLHLFSSAGNYEIRAEVSFQCGRDTIIQFISIVNCDNIDVICPLFVPNVFTPDFDGINDEISPITNCNLSDYEFLIFHRWGGIVYRSTNPSEAWDGSYKGEECPSGVYVYSLKYSVQSFVLMRANGSITLIR